MFITQELGKLVQRFSKTPRLVGDMVHWQHGTYVVRWHDRALRADAYITFALQRHHRAGADGAHVTGGGLQFRLSRSGVGAGAVGALSHSPSASLTAEHYHEYSEGPHHRGRPKEQYPVELVGLTAAQCHKLSLQAAAPQLAPLLTVALQRRE